MKWYKRDPDRAMNGMAVLTLQQRGAYNSILDLLYSRDGDLDDDDAKVARMIRCHGNEWRAVKQQLITAKKIWVEDGKLHAIGVEKALKEARNFSETQSKRVGKRWEKEKTANENNDPPIRAGNTNTTTTTTTTTEEKETKKDKMHVAAPRATRWHQDAVVTSDWLDHALIARRRNGLPDIDLKLQAEQFQNYWASKSGGGATKTDWHRTWINWALKAEGARHGRNGKGPTPHDNFFAAAEEIIRKELGGDAAGAESADVIPFGRPLLPP